MPSSGLVFPKGGIPLPAWVGDAAGDWCISHGSGGSCLDADLLAAPKAYRGRCWRGLV